jgi:hypothetical protein
MVLSSVFVGRGRIVHIWIEGVGEYTRIMPLSIALDYKLRLQVLEEMHLALYMYKRTTPTTPTTLTGPLNWPCPPNQLPAPTTVQYYPSYVLVRTRTRRAGR